MTPFPRGLYRRPGPTVRALRSCLAGSDAPAGSSGRLEFGPSDDRLDVGLTALSPGSAPLRVERRTMDAHVVPIVQICLASA